MNGGATHGPQRPSGDVATIVALGMGIDDIAAAFAHSSLQQIGNMCAAVEPTVVTDAQRFLYQRRRRNHSRVHASLPTRDS